jgi:hypothetical protein
MSLKSFFEEWDIVAHTSDSYDDVRQYRLPSVDVHLEAVSDDMIELDWIASDEQGKGAGSAALELLCRIADGHGVHIILCSASGDGRKQRRLDNWYVRHGFMLADTPSDDPEDRMMLMVRFHAR